MSTRATTWARRAALALITLGALTLVWAFIVWRWEDPFTALYTIYEQHQLAQAYDRRVSTFAVSSSSTHIPAPPGATRHVRAAASQQGPAAKRLETEKRAVGLLARKYRLDSHEGDPLGRIIVPRLGLNMIFLDGTDESSLEKGPGRDLQTFMPGENRLVYIAGHRTTFLAPFSNINELRPGDRITLELPYATFVYSVTRHIIVAYNDMAVLRPGRSELLALQACHPRFFATHRYIVYARPIKVTPIRTLGPAYSVKFDQKPGRDAGTLEARAPKGSRNTALR